MVGIVCGPNVIRYYKNNPQLLVVNDGENWTMVESQFPYKNTALHLLIVPKRHVISLSELRRKEWGDLLGAINLATIKFPFLEKGFGIGLREKEVGGVTLWHLHWHLIAPKIVPDGQIAVNFGIG